jgi:hypothetical protein
VGYTNGTSMGVLGKPRGHNWFSGRSASTGLSNLNKPAWPEEFCLILWNNLLQSHAMLSFLHNHKIKVPDVLRTGHPAGAHSHHPQLISEAQ